jgi:hypothetical protein
MIFIIGFLIWKYDIEMGWDAGSPMFEVHKEDDIGIGFKIGIAKRG